jgi:hypothetical protein
MIMKSLVVEVQLGMLNFFPFVTVGVCVLGQSERERNMHLL